MVMDEDEELRSLTREVERLENENKILREWVRSALEAKEITDGIPIDAYNDLAIRCNSAEKTLGEVRRVAEQWKSYVDVTSRTALYAECILQVLDWASVQEASMSGPIDPGDKEGRIRLEK